MFEHKSSCTVIIEKCHVLMLLFFCTASLSAHGVLPQKAQVDLDVQEVLKKKPLTLEAGGETDIPFRKALDFFEKGDILVLVQKEYAAMLEPGKEPEFTIEQTSSNVYQYVNIENEKSVIREVYREYSSTGDFHLVYYAYGERFFGDFQSVIHVAAAECSNPGTTYDVTVYAHPENRFLRFVVRHIGVVRRYFENKTADIIEMSLEVCKRIVTKSTSPTPPDDP
jgi:hypothetical protein